MYVDTFFFSSLRLARYLASKEDEEALLEQLAVPPPSQSQIGKKNSKKKVNGELKRTFSNSSVTIHQV